MLVESIGDLLAIIPHSAFSFSLRILEMEVLLPVNSGYTIYDTLKERRLYYGKYWIN